MYLSAAAQYDSIKCPFIRVSIVKVIEISKSIYLKYGVCFITSYPCII